MSEYGTRVKSEKRSSKISLAVFVIFPRFFGFREFQRRNRSPVGLIKILNVVFICTGYWRVFYYLRMNY